VKKSIGELGDVIGEDGPPRLRPGTTGSLQHGESMPERQNFRRELEPRTYRGPTRGQQGDEQGSHVPENGISPRPVTATTTIRSEYSAGTDGGHLTVTVSP
jgi:hypothetical protein